MSLDYIHHTLHMHKAYVEMEHTTQKWYIHVPTQTHLKLYIHSHYYSVAKWSEIQIHESHASYDCFMDMDMLVHGVLCLNVRVDRQ